MFMAVYIGTQASVDRSGWNKLDDATRQQRAKAGMEAWGKWADKYRDAIFLPGAPLGKTTRVGADGIRDVINPMSGFVIVRAESQEAAARMFENHPHFTIFPGDSVEIMQCMPPPSV